MLRFCCLARKRMWAPRSHTDTKTIGSSFSWRKQKRQEWSQTVSASREWWCLVVKKWGIGDGLRGERQNSLLDYSLSQTDNKRSQRYQRQSEVCDWMERNGEVEEWDFCESSWQKWFFHVMRGPTIRSIERTIKKLRE